MRSLRLAAVAAVALALSACTTTSPELAVAPAPAASVTVSSAFGDVTLPAEPQAALGMYTTDVDILIALGYPLAKEQPIRGDSGYTTFPSFFPQEALQGVTPFANYPDYNYEKILAASPDFILNGLGYDEKTHERLKEIAPTYSVNAFDGRGWMEHFKETAEALGRTRQYEAWMAKYQARVAEVKAAIGDKAKDVMVAPVSYWDGKVSSSCYSGVECQAFADLGLKVFPDAKKNNGDGVSLSGENLGQLAEIDIAFTMIGVGESGEKEFATMMDTLGRNKVWTALPFVKDNRIQTYEMEMTYGSPSGQLAFLDVVEKAFADA
jgi:iron complex transport system substrate-binding protein